MSAALFSKYRMLWMPLGLTCKAPDGATPRCCADMKEALAFSCDEHTDPFECADALVVYNEPFDEYGLVIHDGGASYALIQNCPWCGTKLPPSQRDRWFDEIDALKLDANDIDSIPERFLTSEWRLHS